MFRRRVGGGEGMVRKVRESRRVKFTRRNQLGYVVRKKVESRKHEGKKKRN